MISVWSATSTPPEFPTLDGNKKTDVLIIGGGLAGILCAMKLKQHGINCILVEAGKLCCGITKNTTAKITSQHGLIYAKLLRRLGEERAKMYLSANNIALSEYFELCRNIDCDFEIKDNYIYSRSNIKAIEEEFDALEKLGYNARFNKTLPLPFPIAAAIGFRKQAQFHPLKFIEGIIDGLNIYENTRVRELNGLFAVCDNGIISADNIIITTHFPFINKHGGYFLKLYQQRSYVTAFSGTPDLQGMYMDEAQNGLSFRNYDNLLFIGSGGTRTGSKTDGWLTAECLAARYYPKSHAEYRWSTQDCISLDGLPYIGRYSKGTKNIYTATGFNKWGMTTSMLSASILCDLITEKKNDYAELFSPSRSILHPQLVFNTLEAVKSLLTPTLKRCPHLGCALKWNPHEHSWDCPCHGSRFTVYGELLDNPSTGDSDRLRDVE